MLAWMRWCLALCCAGAGWGVVGCQSPGGPGDMRARDGEAVSRLPSWNSPEDAEVAEPEILPETHYSAGRLHEAHGRLARAAEQYRLAIGLKPDGVEAYNRLGIVLGQLRHFKEADEAFAHAISLEPDQAYLHNNLAFSYMMQLRWQDAEAELLHALELYPQFARARVNLALVFARQDRFDEAMAQFQLAVPVEDAYFNMGLMYQSKRRLADAARAFKTALELNPKLVAAQKRLDKLPPNIVSAVEAHTAVQASPVPVETRADRTSDKTARPSTQPADHESPALHAPPEPEPSVPLRLSLLIETSTDAAAYEADEPLWMMLVPAPAPDHLVGPPFLEPYTITEAGSPPPTWPPTAEESPPPLTDPAASPTP